jgi:hypothetical protein
MTPQEIATRHGLKRIGREWRGTCPACGYGNGAFVLSISRAGRPLAWCACCQDRHAVWHAISGDVSTNLRAEAASGSASKARNLDRAIAYGTARSLPSARPRIAT